MFKTIAIALLPSLLFFGSGVDQMINSTASSRSHDTGTLEKMIVGGGSVAMDIDVNTLNGTVSRGRASRPAAVRFAAVKDSFFKALIYNGEFRGLPPGTLRLDPQVSAPLPAKLAASLRDLTIESLEWGGQYELAVRDANTGYTFFNIEGFETSYDQYGRSLTLSGGRLLVSPEFASELGRGSLANKAIGEITISVEMYPIEVTQIVDGETTQNVLPPSGPLAGTVPGPDVVVGDLSGLAQFGSSSGGFVGLAVGTDSCNFGTVNLNWFANPANDHPVIPQNLYRMSGGSGNTERFEQVGQSSVKHAFTALTNNICNLGCNGVGGSQLGSGCSDPYSASLNAGPNLGSRAWINPYTGFYPRDDSATRNNDHTGHTHTGPSHRIYTNINDLNTTLNPGATYFAEGQYVTPHEYAWCQSNPTQCNMNNNVSYRQYNVSGTTSFSFTAAAATVRQKAAIYAWTGASFSEFAPAPGADGIGVVGYKVTNPSAGVWHYEYAVYNMNIDRAIQSFSVPVGAGVTLANLGFSAPPQHPGWAADGTTGNAGFSGTPWSPVQGSNSVSWSSESLAQNPNANAIRWGTLYNFRFDSNRPPTTGNATLGFFKTGSPMTVAVQVPSAAAQSQVTVTGRVFSPGGLPMSGVLVSIADIDGGTSRLATLTSSFGYFTFADLPGGRTYQITPVSRFYTFTPQTIQINQDLNDVNFTGIAP